MQLGAATYQSDGEDHVPDGAIVRNQKMKDDELKSTDFKTRSDCCAAIKLHSSKQTCRVCWAYGYGGNNFKMRCQTWVIRDQTGEDTLPYPEPVDCVTFTVRKKQALRKKWLFEVHWKNKNVCVYNCGVYRHKFKERKQARWCGAFRSESTLNTVMNVSLKGPSL